MVWSRACSAGTSNAAAVRTAGSSFPRVSREAGQHRTEDGEDENQARPYVGAVQNGRHRSTGLRTSQGAGRDAQPVFPAAGGDGGDDQQEPGAEHGQQRRQPRAAPVPPPYRQGHHGEHHRGEQGSCVLHRITCGQDDPAADQQSCPPPEWAVSSPDTQPCGQGEQEQRHRVKGREGTQELRAGQGSEQRRGQHRGPLPVQADGRGPQQARDPEHEAHRQDARGSEASQAVRESAQWRVEDGRPGEVRGEMRDGRLVQPPGPFQMARRADRGPRPEMPCWTRRAEATARLGR